MLADLLQSLQALDVPQGAEISFVFVENDTALSIEAVVDEFHKRTGWPAIAILEWLRILWSAAKEAGAQLVGGPVVPIAPVMGSSDMQNEVLKYYEKAASVNDARKEAAMLANRRFDLETNNWMADLSAIEMAGLRFDPEFGLSGGEDTDFSRRAYKAGLTLAWAPKAIVLEEVPNERLSAAYIADRARAQSITKFQMMLAEKPGAAKPRAVAQIIAKGMSGALRIALSPILGRYSYYRGVRALGIAQGFIAGLRGEGQARYSHVTGE